MLVILLYFFSLFVPLVACTFLYPLSASHLPLWTGLSLQVLVGAATGLYLHSLSKPFQNFLYLGFAFFFLGLGFSLVSGKTFWMPFFWEISTLGVFLIFQAEEDPSKEMSLASMFLVSGISAMFLLGWVYLPEDNFYGKLFLLFALLLKSAFSCFHIWYPLFHIGASSVLSGAISAFSSVVPLLLYLQFLHPIVNHSVVFKLLIPVAGLGVFIGGFNSFFSKDIKKSLSYSSIETLNFLWLLLFLAGFWKTEKITAPYSLEMGFFVLFYCTLFHHSLAKLFQFFLFGRITNYSESNSIDANRGVGRLLSISSLLAGLGTFSYILLPGTIGFLSESSYLFMLSEILEIPGKKTMIVVPALIFILFGQILGGVSHLRMYLTIFLSIPSSQKQEKENLNSSAFYFLGFLLFTLPIFFVPSLLFFLPPNHPVLLIFKNWFYPVLGINIVSILFYLLIFRLYKTRTERPKISWDCGNGYAGPELSIPASIISDPLYDSLGTMIEKDTGNSKIDTWILSKIKNFFNLGELWIEKAESGELSNYIAFSSVSLLLTFLMILFIRFYKDAIWKLLIS